MCRCNIRKERSSCTLCCTINIVEALKLAVNIRLFSLAEISLLKVELSELISLFADHVVFRVTMLIVDVLRPLSIIDDRDFVLERCTTQIVLCSLLLCIFAFLNKSLGLCAVFK